MIITKENYRSNLSIEVGGKASQLIDLVANGFNVPAFVVIPSIEFEEPSGSVIQEVQSYFSKHGYNSSFAVRSSANVEDGTKKSFAGLFESLLNVPQSELNTAIETVRNSVRKKRVTEYMKSNKIRVELSMSVIIQVMVNPDVSGVGFGMHPLTHNTEVKVVSSVFGLGEGLVSGLLNADTYSITDNKIEIVLADKTHSMAYRNDGGIELVENAKSTVIASSLNDDMILKIVNTLEQLEVLNEYAHDIEFAIKNDELFLLQARPITVSSNKETERTIWDNSNIVESYPGVTLPLTFSFIRKMYQVVYVQFAQILGTSKKDIQDNIEVYENMLGHLDGKIYYNLRSWYRALAMAPGFQINAAFMEKMMGVKESFTLEEKYIQSTGSARWKVFKSICKVLISFLTLKKVRRRFYTKVDQIIEEYKRRDYEQMTSIELMNEYKSFEQVLSTEWKAPLVNDFFTMIFFGLLNSMTQRIMKEEVNVTNHLLIGSQDIISIEPMKKCLSIVAEIRKDKNAVQLFEEVPAVVWVGLNKKAFRKIKTMIDQYIEKFGERCLEELKLETITYSQDPLMFIELLQNYLGNDIPTLKGNVDALRTKAERSVLNKIRRRPIKRMLFKYVLKRARNLVSNRENLRFERTRGYGVVRQIFSELGVKFSENGHIASDRDIFLLTKEEVFDFIQGTSIDTNLKAIVERRKKEYAGFKNQNLPERIETEGIVNGHEFTQKMKPIKSATLKGIGCSPGLVCKKVTVVKSPREIKDLKNTVMVARSTDPGWITLFPSAAAVIVERGSLLSHTSIVARELGIPCIVAVDHLMDSLKTGDTIRMDGATGEIEVVNAKVEELVIV